MNGITEAQQVLIDSFRPAALDACWTVREQFRHLTDDEFIGHLNNIGAPRADDLMFAARCRAYRDGTMTV